MNASTMVPSHWPSRSQANSEHWRSPDWYIVLLSSRTGQSSWAKQMPFSSLQDHQWQSFTIYILSIIISHISCLSLSAEVDTLGFVYDNDDNNNTYISSNDWIILSTRNPSSQHIRPVKSFISWEYRWNQRLHTGPICLICYFPVQSNISNITIDSSFRCLVAPF